MSETTATASSEPCSTCGTTLWTEAHFVNGSLICSPCAREIRRTVESKPMPPTASQRAQLELWVRGPHRSARL